jgi:hypothetical protein
MWLVDKLHAGANGSREEIPSDIAAAIVRWYVGLGSDADEATGVALVRKAKLFDRWIACGCLGDTPSPPLLSPAYLSEAQTYYLRRLTGEGRPEHDRDCPFHRDQSDWQRAREKPAPKPVARPNGLFAALRPIGEHLAQQRGDGADDDRVRGPSTPRLARLLWTLLDAGRTNIIGAVGERPKPSIAHEFEALRGAAADFWIAPGVPLRPLLFTHRQAFHTRRVHAMLREATATWPDGHEPQAFLALYAQNVTRREIVTGDGSEPIIVASDITKPAARLIDQGPYLVFVAIGHLAQARGFAAVRAYAQPILNGRQFVPVNSNAERAFLSVVLDLQWSLHRSGVATRIKKPIFDEETDLGPCRPDFMIEIRDRHSGRQRLQLVALPGYDDASGARAKAATMSRMESIGPVAAFEIGDLDEKTALRARILALLRD